MDIQNHFYGHSAVLAAYAGRRRPQHVRGLIQHGWTTSSPLAVQFGDFPDVGRDDGRRLLVWSHQSRAWSPDAADRPTTALGAPFAYLAQSAEVTALGITATRGTLVMPLHGTRLIEVGGDHGLLARYYRETEGACTVCLHHDDVARPHLVSAWQQAGHRVVTAGSREDPQFLGRILRLVAEHRRTVSNRLMTSIMYAAALGREVAVHGDPLSLGGADNVSLEWIAATWPELHGQQLDGAAATTTARAEIGWDNVLPPTSWCASSAGPAPPGGPGSTTGPRAHCARPATCWASERAPRGPRRPSRASARCTSFDTRCPTCRSRFRVGCPCSTRCQSRAWSRRPAPTPH
ncbi:hypothetical protein [Nostocoides sp. HKS02]|uniref:hypothetical protein n=1 Tax=Nostocoides sp. HKS02 TaxID=1813880 RepID=UPI0012B4B5AE|nr:hypothetical protein [Tetrasphaera sp. HKS02]QGN56659.1 hypothetical protein GKE56_00695 [Tetrasphaera sp. HKS02]